MVITINIDPVQTDTHTNGPENYVIGFLAPWDASIQEFTALTSASAISIAVDAVHADPTLGNNINLRYVIV